MIPMSEGPAVPYTDYIPESIKRNMGKWILHNVVEPGVVEHVSSLGEKVYSVRAIPAINGRFSTENLRKVSELARKYCNGYMRFTNALNMEFITDDLKKVELLKAELSELGYPVGGWGNHIWSITSCAGYFHCALAATDAPSVAKKIGDSLFKYFSEEELPAKLTVGASGCPSSCGGSFITDIGIIGVHTEIPIVTEAAKNCDAQGTAFVCPVGAIQLQALPEGGHTLNIRENLCIGCGLCVGACSGIIFETPEESDGHAILVGGRSSASEVGTQFGRVVVPYIPNEPPNYDITVGIVLKIVETWKKDAKKGERIFNWINRIGWEKFYAKTGIPYFEQSMDDLDLRAITKLRDGGDR